MIPLLLNTRGLCRRTRALSSSLGSSLRDNRHSRHSLLGCVVRLAGRSALLSAAVTNWRHNAAKQYLGLIAAGHGARRACVNRAAPSGWQWAPRRPGGAGVPGVLKKNESSPLEQSLQGLECLRGPPGTGFSMIWCLLRTMGVVLLYLSVAGRAWRCGSAILTELLPFNVQSARMQCF
jgi:hypothetical protein